ncbi:curlin repeat-containing protein [Halanaerobacter jeridensis]|uniref:Curlin associated repeat-containing protein n=1 Tax=Halanaerobacter jeridensis TaxID=706427 RepID=A0A938XXY9_9FIRM|nr:curlin repeat-containing protein [Halanaerobacter jeridensis]MBM7557717.1 hypothetical protein [Halanaerobacter jeridensis]
MRKLLVLSLAVMVVMSYSGLIYAADGNTAEVEQNGTHEAYVFQGGLNNEATIQQGHPGNTPHGHVVDVWQEGKANVINVSQRVHNNTVEAMQFGKANEINVRRQSGWGNNMIDVLQDGDKNKVDILQKGGRDSAVRLEQYNDGNEFTLTQDGYDQYKGHNNQVKGVKESSGNLRFAGNRAAQQFNGALFTGTQLGDNNKIGLRQGKNDIGVIYQEGQDNMALLYQAGSVSHTATITQKGVGSKAEVCQK